ncbi:murein biosynthesis integral membrane protein MurJ [Emcibacter nanhaiensis]|uniref:Probable lipid II flippase MurJ n=1 Tax=Emcibacter nanhaiensis TaxID=1505037 RepID=A0A501PJ46_9PROT|nr:murein biosynthesis integral membrane protein MurJ [Emcibacter nanhaiensis]TPD59776.1 murein biosynthesis integral membrane protein MurJ [Emcibacter nanhaiensis]
MSILKATAIFGSFTFLSRILGFARDILLASILGAGMVADCFVVAFKLPNFFRRLFAEGAFSAAFVPMFSATLEQDGREEAIVFAEEAFAGLLIVLLLLVGLMELFAPAVIYVLAGGFVDDRVKFDLAVLLTRITFPFILFISLVSLLGGILNSLGRFAETAAMPIILNIFLIAALVFFANMLDTPAHALAVAVSLAGLTQLFWLWVACRRAGYRIRLKWPHMTPKVRELLKIMAPAALGAGVIQMNLMLDMILASHLPDGSMSFLFYADRLNQLPIGVIGVALGTVLLPMLSREIAAGNGQQVIHSQNRAIEMGLFFTVPAAVAFIVVPYELIHVLLERNRFTPEDTVQTAMALAAYAAGLPAYVLAKVFSPGYFARKDTRTPVKFAMIALVVNVVLNIALMIPFKHVGLALATAISAWVNVALLCRGLMLRGHFHFDSRALNRLVRYVICSLLMGAVVWYVSTLTSPLIAGALAEKIAGISALVVTGIATYILLAFLTGAVRREDLAVLRRRKS